MIWALQNHQNLSFVKDNDLLGDKMIRNSHKNGQPLACHFHFETLFKFKLLLLSNNCLNLASHNQTKKPLFIFWHFWTKMEFWYTFFVAGEWVECSVWGDFRHARYAMSCDDICRWIAKLNLPKWMLCKQTSLRMIPENLAPKKFKSCSFNIHV